MVRHWRTRLLIGLLLTPYIVNLLGWNVYLYLNLGEKDLILAAAQGLSHTAWADHSDFDASPLDAWVADDPALADLFDSADPSVTLLNVGPRAAVRGAVG